MSTTINASATVTAIASLTLSGSYPLDSTNNPTHASTSMVGGKVTFENDNYRISMGDNNNVNIYNKHTGESYDIAGDPHVSVDGQHAFDFWGKTTFNLDDGTKVTIDTTPWKNNPNATLASKVTITNGDYGVQVTGVDSNTVGDLKYHETENYGHLLDALVTDGNKIYENPFGKGFLGLDRQGRLESVDQNFINKTDLVKGGAQRLQDQYADAFLKLSSLLAVTFAGRFMSALGQSMLGAGQQSDGGSTTAVRAQASASRSASASAHTGAGDLSFSFTLTRSVDISVTTRATAVA